MGISAAIQEIIKESEKFLFLLSPFIKIPTVYKNHMRGLKKKGVEIRLISRPFKDISEDDIQFYKELTNLKIFYCDNIHAKCYMNEKRGIITSLNLYEYS